MIFTAPKMAKVKYKALLRELGYAEDFDLADLEISLAADGLLDTFREEFQALHSRPWEIRRKLGRGINEASAVLNKLDQKTYPNADSWAKSLGQGRADITPNLLAERACELATRRQSDKALIFIIDEVGQYVSRSVDKMLDLQAVVQAFGREGKNRVNRRQATAPCWIVVTSQEKLHEVVDALDSRKIELARLQDRFPYPIDLKQSDISEVTSKRELLQEIFADPSIRGSRYQNRKPFPFVLTIDGEVVESSGQLPLALLIADDLEDFDASCEEARRTSNEKRYELFWVCALTDEVHRHIEELYRSREMVSMHERLAAQGKLSPEEASCLAEEKVRRDRFQRTLRTRLAERVAVGAGFFQGVRKDASALGQSMAEIFAKLRDDAIPTLYPKFALGNRPVSGDEEEKFLTAANLNGLPSIFYEEPDGLNLVIRQSGKTVPNLNAEICREVLDYLKREHAYGNKVTGKALDTHFQGIGYAWEREVLRIVLAVLLRGGAIEVTHQGRKYRNHNDPACRQPFINNNVLTII